MMCALPSALSNFRQAKSTAGSALTTIFSLLGYSNVMALGHSRWLHALHDNFTRQLSKYSAGTRHSSCPLAAMTIGFGGGCTDT